MTHSNELSRGRCGRWKLEWTRLLQSSLPLGLFILLLSPATLAQNFERGRYLYENHCQACHSDQLHRRENSKVKSLQDLRRHIASWGEHAGEKWESEEINDVMYYLDRTFYHFGQKLR